MLSEKISKNSRKILVTGGLGFIGSHFVRMALERGYSVINVDKKTYAARKDLDFDKFPSYEFIEQDICDMRSLPYGIESVVNFAAESHVDNSIISTADFFSTNVRGVYNLLELVRKEPGATRPLFIQISTDEVYGDTDEGSFTEKDRLKPSSPYSATKAAADQLVLGWARTYNLRVRITRSANNYGYGQYAEKLIPATIKLTSKGRKVSVHGNGEYRREWIFAEDKCEAIFHVMEKGEDGEIYNITTNEEYSNLEIVRMILREMGKPEDFFTFSANRPGQDTRYSVDAQKIRALGWKPKMTLKEYIPIYLKLCEEGRLIAPQGIRRQFVTKVLNRMRKPNEK